MVKEMEQGKNEKRMKNHFDLKYLRLTRLGIMFRKFLREFFTFKRPDGL